MQRDVKRRGGPLVRKVLEAVLTEISEVGFDRLSVERVAATAGVNKTTIYRRWPDQQQLVEAALNMLSDIAPLPDTGTLRSDLEEYLRRFAIAAAGPGMQVILRYRHSNGNEDLAATTLRSRFEAEDVCRRTILAKAMARGEISGDTDLDLLSQIIGGAAERVLFYQPFDEKRVLALSAYFAKCDS